MLLRPLHQRSTLGCDSIARLRTRLGYRSMAQGRALRRARTGLSGRHSSRFGCGVLIITAALFISVVRAAGVSAGVSKGVPTESQLRAGEVVIEDVTSDDGVAGLRATFWVRATSDAVWNLLTDYAHYREVFTNVEDLSVLDQDARGARLRFRVKAAWLSFDYTLQRTYEVPGRLLTWRRVDGDFRRISGKWAIADAPDPGYAQVTCESYLDIGFLVPTALVRQGAEAEMRRTMLRIKQHLQTK